MKNKILTSLLLLPVVVLGICMLRLNYMSNFEKVEVAVRGYDPKDFFSGYYMYLRPDWENTDCTQFADNVCPKDNFNNTYTFYIKREQSDKITIKVNAGVVKLQFSYSAGFEPIITDLLVDGQSFMDFIEEKK